MAAAKRTQRPADAWQAFAYARGLALIAPTGGLVDQRGRVVEGIIDDVPLVVDTCMESSRDRWKPHTRVTAKPVRAVDVRLAVLSRQPLVDAPQGRLEGTDDPAFDEEFFVKATPPVRARAVLDDEVRAAMLRFKHPLLFTYDGELARMFWEGEERDRDALDLATEIVLTACRWRGGQAGYR